MRRSTATTASCWCYAALALNSTTRWADQGVAVSALFAVQVGGFQIEAVDTMQIRAAAVYLLAMWRNTVPPITALVP